MPPNKRKFIKKTFFRFCHFLSFLAITQPKLTKNKENWQNPNRLMKFSEIWYVDASQQKNATKKFFLDSGSFWSFFNQKTAKIYKNEENSQNPNRLMKFSEIWYVVVPNKKMLQKNFFWIAAFLAVF